MSATAQKADLQTRDVIADTDLPEGWDSASVGEVLTVNYGRGLKEADRVPGETAVFGCNGVVGRHRAALTCGPTIIIGRKGTIGAVHFSPRPCWPIDTTYFIDDFRGLDPIYVTYALRSLNLGEHDTSTAIPGLNRDDLYSQRIPLAPLAEQKRIVAKTEELFTQFNAARDRLAKVPLILKRFRQAVLAAACSGRLTEDWRVKNTAVEPAYELLLRIKEKRLESAKTKKERIEIITAFQDDNLRLPEDELALDGIPDSWIGGRVGAIGAVCNGSTPSRKRPEFWNGYISWVSSGEVRNNIITQTNERITNAGYESCSVRLLPKGTVLIAMIGEGKTRGQAATLDIEATINQNIAGVKLEHGLVSPKYLWFWFQMQYEATRERGSGSGPQALNCQRVRELPLVLPPLAEQHEIVRRVEALFKLADASEKRVAVATKRAKKLTQAILAKASRGELVPTEAELARREDRSYEPASVLLDRIRTEHASADTGAPIPRESRLRKTTRRPDHQVRFPSRRSRATEDN